MVKMLKKGGGQKETTGAGKSWFAVGKEGIAKSKQEAEAARLRRENKLPFRFWQRNNEEGLVTFLDSPVFFFHEHNLQIGGKFGNFFTCLQDFDTCPLCSTDTASYVLAATIIDHREYQDSEGEIHKNVKRLFVAKGKARENLVKLIEDNNNDIQYAVFKIWRGSGATECNTGEGFTMKKKLTRAALKAFIPKDAKEGEKWLDPFDYRTIFAPRTPEELRKLVGMAPPVGSEEETEKSGAKDEPKGKGKKDERPKKVDNIEDLL